ncbi:elongation factor 1-delta-like [Chironomus tepperi]|uniref:elongation factor 1-delta-like n=1 Tax=Chironomus tepperi TaxID=113505 RepID=UPI00391F9646
MSIAVDRIQNYYQYSDAEAKFYQLLNPEVQEVKEEVVEEKLCPKESNQDVKPKKAKKNNKKKENSENVQKTEEPVKQQQSEKPKKIVVKEASKDEESLKDDSGIAESPTEPTASTATKKKSRSKRQREKKAAEKAAAASSQQAEVQVQPKVENVPKPEPVIPKPVQETPKPKETVANKKKKNNKNASSDQKPVKDESKNGVSSTSTATSTLATEIAKARQHIKSSLERVDGVSNFNITGSADLLERISHLEKDNASLRGLVDGMQKLVVSLETRLNKLEGTPAQQTSVPTPAPAPAAAKKDEEEDDDVDLFGSDDEEDAEAEKLKEERVKAYTEKKAKKPVLIAKSSILLDVKPWDDETDMKEMEKQVRTVEMDGLLWGASKLIPLAYGIKKLQIMCVIEDDKVSVDELQEKIQEFEDYVQSVDIAAFNKI